jgi:hypothetical protein
MWGGWTGVEEKFELTPQLEKVTKLGAGTVTEVSRLAIAALIRGEQRAGGFGWCLTAGRSSSRCLWSMKHKSQLLS